MSDEPRRDDEEPTTFDLAKGLVRGLDWLAKRFNGTRESKFDMRKRHREAHEVIDVPGEPVPESGKGST